MKKNFTIGTVLSISHDTLLTEIGNVYEILNFMLDEKLFTHQLPRAGKFARPFVFQQHPQLEEWNEFTEQINTSNWKEYVEKAEGMFGKFLEIEKVPSGVFTHKDPIEEAEEMVGKENVIAVTIPSPENKTN